MTGARDVVVGATVVVVEGRAVVEGAAVVVGAPVVEGAAVVVGAADVEETGVPVSAPVVAVSTDESPHAAEPIASAATAKINRSFMVSETRFPRPLPKDHGQHHNPQRVPRGGRCTVGLGYWSKTSEKTMGPPESR